MKRFLLDPSKAAGDLYSPVVVAPESLARRAASARVITRVLSVTEELDGDPYTQYVSEFYRRGLSLSGDEWGFMDIVTVLYAVAELGQPENYMEIGVRRGRSVCAVAAAAPRTNIYAFDMWQEGYANNDNPGPALVRRELAKVNHLGTVNFISGDSHQTVPRFFRDHPELSFDCITVDGDHSVEGAWDDLRNVVPRLRVGGVLVFDDTCNPYCPGLGEVWDDLLKADSGLRAYSYNQLGTGVSFAIRMKESEFIDARGKKGWSAKYRRGHG